MNLQFKKAVKRDARGRVALVGPAGSGKSYTMLVLARLLAGPEGKIAAVDTEHGSLSKYADQFSFDVIELAQFTQENFQAAMDAAEAGGYAVVCVDSLSHFWMGAGGALEFVDERSKKHRDQMGGWKDFRPHERAMVDRMIASPCHVIVTMRTKNEYVTEEQIVDGRKKTVRRKVGLAPVQREGLEYEFDLCMTGDDDNAFLVDKTRCPAYAGRVLTKPSAKDFGAFQEWLKGEAPALPAPAPAAGPLLVPPSNVPDEALLALWERGSKSGKEAMAILAELRDRMAFSVGNNKAQEVCARIKAEVCGEKQPHQSLTLWRRLVERLYWEEIDLSAQVQEEAREQAARRQAEGSQEITDDDLPPQMFPEEVASGQ